MGVRRSVVTVLVRAAVAGLPPALVATQGGARVTGYTLSRTQAEYARRELGQNVELRGFVTCDYPDAHYDRIYAIGAWEHVRRQDVATTLAKLHRALKPEGRLVMQFFCPLEDSIPAWLLTAQIFFPGSAPPAYPRQLQAFGRAGFRVSHLSIHDYRPTLCAWFDRLVAARERAIEVAGLETYNRYLVFFAVSWRFFNDGYAILGRYRLEKARA